jgi:antitoxin component YwqK of YwqJK toxin-antitoxin module
MRFFSAIAISLLLLNACGDGGTDSSGNTLVDSQNIEATEIDSNYCNCDELTLDQPYNHFWRFERRVGYTGVCEEFYTDGKLKTTKNLVDGKLHGKVLTYYQNGRLHEEKEFDMNFQTGEQIVYTSKGEVKLHALYKRGTQTQILVNRPELQEEDPWESAN